MTQKGFRPDLLTLPVQSESSFYDVRSPHWASADGPFAFLRLFRAHLLCYIHDSENFPIIHSYGVDGLTPKTIAFPNPARQASGYGIFFSVNGFKTDMSRKTENLYSLNTVYADIDYPQKKNPPTDRQIVTFKRAVMEDLVSCISFSDRDAFLKNPSEADCAPAPTAIVETKNGYHVYWVFQKPILLDDPRLRNNPELRTSLLETYGKIEAKIIERFHGDLGAKDVTRVLRVPGSYHLKHPNDPFLVRLVHFSPETTYTFGSLRKFWLSNPDATAPHEVKPDLASNERWSKEAASMFKRAGDKESLTEAEWQRIDAEYLIEERPSIRALLTPSGIPEGQRNKCLLIAASALRRAGWSEERVLSEVVTSGYSGLAEYEIRNTVKSAFRRATPYVFGWNDPILSQYVTLEEVSEIVRRVIAIRQSRRKPSNLGAGEEPEKVPKEIIEQKHLFGVPEQYPVLPRDIKKALYDHFEIEFVKAHPDVFYVENLGFYQRKEEGWYENMTHESVECLVNRLLYRIGLADKRGTSNIAAKVKSLQAFESIRLTRESLEFATNTLAGEGTFLNVRTGILDIDSGRMIPRNPKMFFMHRVDADPLNDPQCPNFESFIAEIAKSREDVVTRERIQLIQEACGYALTPYNHFQKAFLFIGRGSNGKSTLMDIFTRLLGTSNVSQLNFKQLNGQFNLHTLYQKRLNIVEEVKKSEQHYFDSDILKKIISGQMVDAERKFVQDPFSFRPFVKLFILVNDFPRFSDAGFAFYRRFLVIPFEQTFDGSRVDPFLPDKLWKERSGILRWAMEGWQRLQRRGCFYESKETIDALDAFRESNSPVVEFLLNNYMIESETERVSESDAGHWIIPFEDVYNAYRRYAGTNGYGTKSRNTFKKELSDLTHSRLHAVSLQTTLQKDYVCGIRMHPLNPFPPLL